MSTSFHPGEVGIPSRRSRHCDCLRSRESLLLFAASECVQKASSEPLEELEEEYLKKIKSVLKAPFFFLRHFVKNKYRA
jgi:hypothetical protein